MKCVRARQIDRIFIHRLHADRARRARSPRPTPLRRGLRLALVRGHAVLLVAALLPVLGLALGPAVAHELAAGAGAEGDAGLLGEAAVGALPATRQGLLFAHCALKTATASRFRVLLFRGEVKS